MSLLHSKYFFVFLIVFLSTLYLISSEATEIQYNNGDKNSTLSVGERKTYYLKNFNPRPTNLFFLFEIGVTIEASICFMKTSVDIHSDETTCANSAIPNTTVTKVITGPPKSYWPEYYYGRFLLPNQLADDTIAFIEFTNNGTWSGLIMLSSCEKPRKIKMYYGGFKELDIFSDFNFQITYYLESTKIEEKTLEFWITYQTGLQMECCYLNSINNNDEINCTDRPEHYFYDLPKKYDDNKFTFTVNNSFDNPDNKYFAIRVIDNRASDKSWANWVYMYSAYKKSIITYDKKEHPFTSGGYGATSIFKMEKPSKDSKDFTFTLTHTTKADITLCYTSSLTYKTCYDEGKMLDFEYEECKGQNGKKKTCKVSIENRFSETNKYLTIEVEDKRQESDDKKNYEYSLYTGSKVNIYLVILIILLVLIVIIGGVGYWIYSKKQKGETINIPLLGAIS